MISKDENSSFMTFYQRFFTTILQENITSKQAIHRLKMKLCKVYKLKSIPSNSEIITHIPQSYTASQKNILIQVLQRKPMRTISGVAVIAIMTSPAYCPHGRCSPCPGGPKLHSPQSYTGFEPAAMRGGMYHFDPYQQVRARLDQLQSIGHPTDKIDLIIMGGTFTSRLPVFQQWFVKRCFDALNNKNSPSIAEAQRINEQATHRCIGLTIETRPDWLRLRHLDEILWFGATRIELGVQSINDSVLYQMDRGHTVIDTVAATRLAKEAGLKVCYHLMPGLPGSSENQDIEHIKEIFKNSRFIPDMLKIYPTIVIKNTRLYEQWKKGTYQPLSTDKATEIITKMIQYIPEFVRIQRIQRDVPAQYIEAGVDKSNLRQLVEEKIIKTNQKNKEIRSREIGHAILQNPTAVSIDDIVMKKITYEASGGTEIFLSLCTKTKNFLIGYLRLRKCTHPHRYELQQDPSMIIRELKVVGKELPLGKKDAQGWQHKGFGKQLVSEAERISIEEFDAKQLYVLSGTGVKPYYRKNFGFTDKGIYLMKTLSSK